jgi:hypothetical protein
MSNKVRGAVSFKAGDNEFILHLSTNAMCELEDEFDMDIESLFNSLDPANNGGKAPRIGHMRKIVKAMLSDNHGDLTLPDVGKIIDLYGLENIFSKVEESAVLAFPDQGENGRRC